ncbi:MAG: HAD family hydrolase [Planctomycetota bacterium]|jgi:putative hydrolase of the HAD superfamily
MSDRQYILWDFDDTLACRPGKWSGMLAHMANQFRPPMNLSIDDFRPLLSKRYFWSKPECEHHHLSDPDLWWSAMLPLFVEAFTKVGFSEDEAQLLAGRVRYHYINPAYWRLFDDTIEALSGLSNLGWTHAILSNHVPELCSIIEALGLADYFCAVFNSAETGIEKPNLKAYRHAINSLGTDVEALWMVGDNVVADVLTPESLGIRSILVRNEDPRVRRCCASLLDVEDVINNSG